MGVPGSPRDVHLTVTVNSAAPGDFTIEPDPIGSLPVGPNGELIFRNDGHSGFFVYFDLKDPNKLGYKFPPDHKISDAIWSELGAGACPTKGVWDVFAPRKILNGDLTLKARNPNVLPELGPFGYTLRVTKDGGKTYLALDPGGVNQNGSIGTKGFGAAAALIAGAVAGALAVLGVQALLS